MWQPEPKIIYRLGKQHVLVFLCNNTIYFLVLIFIFWLNGVFHSEVVFFYVYTSCILFFSPIVFNLDIILPHLLTFGWIVVKTVHMRIYATNKCGRSATRGRANTVLREPRKDRELTRIESTFCGTWGLAFLLICSYLILSIVLKAGFLYRRINSLLMLRNSVLDPMW